MDIRYRCILPLTVDDLPVVTCLIQKNPSYAHLLPQLSAPLYFRFAQTLAVAQANVTVYPCGRTTACQGCDDPSCLFVFVRTDSVGIAVRAMVRKLDSIAEHNDVKDAERANGLLDVATGPVYNTGISVVDGQALRHVRTELGLRRKQAEPSEDRHYQFPSPKQSDAHSCCWIKAPIPEHGAMPTYGTYSGT